MCSVWRRARERLALCRRFYLACWWCFLLCTKAIISLALCRFRQGLRRKSPQQSCLYLTLAAGAAVTWATAHCMFTFKRKQTTMSFNRFVTSTWSKVTGDNLCKSFATNVGTWSGSVSWNNVIYTGCFSSHRHTDGMPSSRRCSGRRTVAVLLELYHPRWNSMCRFG